MAKQVIVPTGKTAKVRNAAFKGFKDGASEFLGNQIENIVGYKQAQFNSHEMKWTDLVLEEDKPHLKQVFLQALKGDKTYMREYRVRTRSGDILWIREWSQIVCDDTGEMDFVTGIVMDITDEKEEEMLLLRCERKTGKYLTFSMAGEDYGITILKIKEIMEVMPITAMPRVPSYVRGVINLRGKVIPVVDLRAKLGLMESDYTGHACIIVLETTNGSGRRGLTGIVVDSVSEVIHIKGADIEDSPDMIAKHNGDYIVGMAKVESGLKIILDVEKVLGELELETAVNF